MKLHLIILRLMLLCNPIVVKRGRMVIHNNILETARGKSNLGHNIGNNHNSKMTSNNVKGNKTSKI